MNFDTKNSYETINLKLVLNDYIRYLLNDQFKISEESKHNVTLMNYNEYAEKVLHKTTITRELLKLLFEQYPSFEKLKNSLIISTFRTGLLTPHGMNGETVFHRDNILFGNGKNRNLIITWGPGTESIGLLDSEIFTNLRENFIETHGNYKKWFETCRDKWVIGEYIKKHNIPLIKSVSPDTDGNINCLIMSGEHVYHRREQISDELLGTYRYVLNIYYNSSDL